MSTAQKVKRYEGLRRPSYSSSGNSLFDRFQEVKRRKETILEGLVTKVSLYNFDIGADTFKNANATDLIIDEVPFGEFDKFEQALYDEVGVITRSISRGLSVDWVATSKPIYGPSVIAWEI